MKDKITEIDAIWNNTRIVRPPLASPTSGKKMRKFWRAKKESSSLQENVLKYNVVAELALASSGMNFEQLLCEDKDEGRKQLKKSFAKTDPVTQGSVLNPLGGLWRLKFVSLKA